VIRALEIKDDGLRHPDGKYYSRRGGHIPGSREGVLTSPSLDFSAFGAKAKPVLKGGYDNVENALKDRFFLV